MTPTEALGQIYAMRESIANGWKPNQDQELALALADMLEEVKADAERYRWLRDKSAGQWEHPICVEQHRSDWGMRYIGPLTVSALDKAIDAARGKHEPF